MYRTAKMPRILLTCCFLLTLMAGTVWAAPDLSNNEASHKPERNADGTYVLREAPELFWFAEAVNGGDTELNAVLEADIDLESQDFTPIGNEEQGYSGCFDGNGHEISGLSVNKEDNYAGLFGYVYFGTVKDLSVSGTVTGNSFVGGVAGKNYCGAIENCLSACAVAGNNQVGGITGMNESRTSASCVTGCLSVGLVTGTRSVGGIVGQNTHTASIGGAYVENCRNTGEVNGNYSNILGELVGGVVGYNYASLGLCTIAGCSNSGSVQGYINVGGVTGRNFAYEGTANVTQCYNTGTVSSMSIFKDEAIGGVAGSCNGIIGHSAQITECYSTGDVTGTAKNVGALVGKLTGANSTNNRGSGYAKVIRSYCLIDGEVNTDREVIGFIGTGASADEWTFSLTKNQFGEWESFHDWDAKVWHIRNHLSPAFSPVTARPTILAMDEPAAQVNMSWLSADTQSAKISVCSELDAIVWLAAYGTEGQFLAAQSAEITGGENPALTFDVAPGAKILKAFAVDSCFVPLCADISTQLQ